MVHFYLSLVIPLLIFISVSTIWLREPLPMPAPSHPLTNARYTDLTHCRIVWNIMWSSHTGLWPWTEIQFMSLSSQNFGRSGPSISSCTILSYTWAWNIRVHPNMPCPRTQENRELESPNSRTLDHELPSSHQKRGTPCYVVCWALSSAVHLCVACTLVRSGWA